LADSNTAKIENKKEAITTSPSSSAKLSTDQKTTLQKTGAAMSTATKYLMMPSLAVLGYVGKLMQNEFIFDG